MNICDPTLSIGRQAWAVAAMLNQSDGLDASDDFHCETSAWYNGRERGLVFRCGTLFGPVLCIAVFEHRNSDTLCALRWEAKLWGINPPTIESDGDAAYHGGNKYNVAHEVGYGNAGKMAQWIAEQFQAFVAKA